MQLSTTFRHMEASKAVKEYAEERLEKIRKYLHRDPLSAHAVFSVERIHHHTAELSITLPNGLFVQARETTDDMYSSIDLAGARIERQVRKWKEKIREHKPHSGATWTVRERVLTADDLDPLPGSGMAAGGEPAGKGAAESDGRKALAPPTPAAFNVVKEQTVTVRAMRVDEAVMQLNLLENDFLVFSDVDTKAISVVYRRKDGDYGLIETGARSPQA